MKNMGIFEKVNDEIGHIIVAEINNDNIKSFVDPNSDQLRNLITKS